MLHWTFRVRPVRVVRYPRSRDNYKSDLDVLSYERPIHNCHAVYALRRRPEFPLSGLDKLHSPQSWGVLNVGHT